MFSPDGVAPTLASGTTEGMNIVPSVIQESPDVTISFQERNGCDGGGKGILIQTEHTGALTTLQNQYVLTKP